MSIFENRLPFVKRVYLDNTATTKTRKEVYREIEKYFYDIYGNPSSIHKSGMVARGSIELARERIANILNCNSEEIVFTGSGSEGNNTAIRGVAKALMKKGNHIITSKIEHSSVLETCKDMEKEGFRVTYLNIDRNGVFDLKQLEKSITKKTILVSLMWVNNEIGTIEPIDDILRMVKDKGVLMHIDAVQAMPYVKIDLQKLKIDLMTISGHKLYAPKGVGALFIRSGTPIKALITGGEQEFGLRSGTENVPYIMGFSKAMLLNDKEKEDYSNKLTAMRDYTISEISKIPNCMLTGHPSQRVPNNISFCFKGLNGKMLVKELSQYGIEVSSGSACSSPKNTPSHVLQACGVSKDYLYGSLRVTLGRYNTMGEIRYLLRVLPTIVKRMREDKTEHKNEQAFISQKDFKEKLRKNKDLQIIDVRPSLYPGKTILGSVYIPYWALKYRLSKLDKKKETIVVCYQGDIFSPEAYQILVKNGFKHVKILKGGLWNYKL